MLLIYLHNIQKINLTFFSIKIKSIAQQSLFTPLKKSSKKNEFFDIMRYFKQIFIKSITTETQSLQLIIPFNSLIILVIISLSVNSTLKLS